MGEGVPDQRGENQGMLRCYQIREESTIDTVLWYQTSDERTKDAGLVKITVERTTDTELIPDQ